MARNRAVENGRIGCPRQRRRSTPCASVTGTARLWFRSLAYDRAEQSFPFVRLKLVQALRHELADQLGQSGVSRLQDLVQQPLRQLLVAFGASSQFLETIRNPVPDSFRCCGHWLDPPRIIGLPAEKFQAAESRRKWAVPGTDPNAKNPIFHWCSRAPFSVEVPYRVPFGKLNRTTSRPAAAAADPGTGSRRPVTGVTGNIASGLVFKPNAGDRVRGFCQRMHRHRAESAGHARWERNVADGPGLVSNRSGHGRAERRG